MIRVEFAPALMTRELAAYYLSLSVSEVDELRATRQITPVGTTKRIKFRKSDLDSYIATLQERPTVRD